MTDIVERVRIALQEVGVRVSELEDELQRLRALVDHHQSRAIRAENEIDQLKEALDNS